MPWGESTVAWGESTVAWGKSTVAWGESTVAWGKSTIDWGKSTVDWGKSTMPRGRSTVASARTDLFQARTDLDQTRGGADPDGPLPCWEHLSPEQIRARVGAIVQRIEETATKESGSAALGAAAVRAQNPLDQPAKPKKSPAPLFHAFTRRVRRELYEAYHLFLTAFRDAADRWRAGDRTVRFPLGSFPPALPFVSALAPLGAPG